MKSNNPSVPKYDNLIRFAKEIVNTASKNKSISGMPGIPNIISEAKKRGVEIRRWKVDGYYMWHLLDTNADDLIDSYASKDDAIADLADRMINELNSEVKKKRPAIPNSKKSLGEIPETNLIQEARKYKSAEEFVKAKTRNFGLPTRDVADEVYSKIYAGEKPIIKNLSDLNPTETKGTRDLLGIKNNFSDITAREEIKTPIIVNEKGTILDGHTRYYQALTNGDKTIPVFVDKPSGVIKSQLTDIWNKANKRPPIPKIK